MVVDAVAVAQVSIESQRKWSGMRVGGSNAHPEILSSDPASNTMRRSSLSLLSSVA